IVAFWSSENCRRLRAFGSFGSFGSFRKWAPRSYDNSGAREFQFHAGQDRRAICLLPEKTDYPWVDECLETLCSHVDAQDWSLETKQQVGQKIADAPTLHLHIHRKLVLARQWSRYRWLPVPKPLEFAIATIEDLGFLGQLNGSSD
ncbi:MAG: hypothetical protein ACKOUR_15720, partial [Planctomycetota bacterium]